MRGQIIWDEDWEERKRRKGEERRDGNIGERIVKDIGKEEE